MRAIIAVLFLAPSLSITASVAVAREPTWTEQGFELSECAANATDILVVNPQGSVIEVWKGNTRPGEVVPIHALANLTLTQPRRPDKYLATTPRATHLSFEAWSGDGGERLIVFLIKSDSPDPTNGLLNSWRPASRFGFDHSVATARRFGGVYVQPRPASNGFSTGLPDRGARGSEEMFKERVLEALWRAHRGSSEK